MRRKLVGGSRLLLQLAMGIAALTPLAAGAVGGGVTSSTVTHSFVVQGTSARAIVSYMNGHAFEGDHGAAYASIHPNYQLMLATQQRGTQCVVRNVSVNVAFDLTLPLAANPGGMSPRTRAAWNNFAGFARAHEAHHKGSYLGCATAFVAQAKRQSASQCFVLESNIRQMLMDMKRNCELKQVPFDRAQAQVLVRLRLFAMARSQSFR